MLLSEFLDDVRRDAPFLLTGPFNGNVSGIVCFASAAHILEKALANEHVSAVIVADELSNAALAAPIGVAVSPNPREAFFLLHNKIVAASEAALPGPSIADSADVAPTARIGRGGVICGGATIADFAFVGSRSVVGEGAFVGEGAVIGVAGHFEQWALGRRLRVQHGGAVRIGAGAQVLAGAVVQKGIFEVETSIGVDAVIGPGVLLAHGVSVGEGAVVTGGVTVAGYTSIGSSVWIGPGSTIGNNLEIGENARIEIGSTVIQSVSSGARVSGNFAIRHASHLRAWRELTR